MDKLKIILDLVRRGAITDEQAEALLKTEKEYVYRPEHIYYYPRQWTYPYYYGQGGLTYTSTSNPLATLTTTTSNFTVDGNVHNCSCGNEDCEPKQAVA